MKKYYGVITIALIAASCQDTEIANSKDVNPETIYTSYSVVYREDDNKVETRAQFRFGGITGTTLVLNAPSSIKLNGRILSVDSTKAQGAFYDAVFNTAAFTGKHTYVFTNANNKIYTNEFVFKPLKLVTKIPATITAKNLALSFTGLKDGSLVNITVADTAFKTDNIAVTDTLQNGTITINANSLKALSSGPLRINIDAFITGPLQQKTTEGGKLTIRHALKERATILKQ